MPLFDNSKTDEPYTPAQERTLDDLAAEVSKLSPERRDQLLDRIEPGPKPPKQARPRHNRQDTSSWAMQSAAPHKEKQEDRLLALFEDAGSDGLIDDQISNRLGMLIQSVTPCRGDLVLGGKVVKTTLLRNTRNGRAAIVWMAAAHAKPSIRASVLPWVPGAACQRVLDALKVAASEGLTDKSGAELLGVSRSKFQSNRTTLVKRGLVKDSGAVVIGARNSKSKLWVLPRGGGVS